MKKWIPEILMLSLLLGIGLLLLSGCKRPLSRTHYNEEKVVEIHMATKDPVSTGEEKVNDSLVKIVPFKGGTCSGSFIDDDGDILTARHCVNGFDTFEIQTWERKLYVGTVVATSAVHDLALIHVALTNTPHFELANSAIRGETIYVLGSPLAITDVLSKGVIARLDGDVTLLDCGALPGNSGSAVFNEEDELVGVVNAGLIVMAGTTHLNEAQGLETVRAFLEEVRRQRYGNHY